MKYSSLKKRIILVCGSSRGIGLKIAETFLENGDIVILSSRHISINSTIKKIQSKYKNSMAIYKCDFSKKKKVINLRKKLIKKFKKLDILITNAGKSSGRIILPLKDSEMLTSINHNLMSCVYPVEIFLKNLIKSKGKIVAISSIAGMEFLGAPIAYSVSKSALNTFVKSISKIYGNKIRINFISPGNIYFKGGVWDKKIKNNKKKVMNFIKKEVPQQIFGRPEDVASAVHFLCSNRANFINGSNLVIDGGQLNYLK